MSRARRLLLAAVSTALLVAPGCAQKASGPSQEAYVAAADGACEAADQKIEDLYHELAVATWDAAAAGESYTYADRPDRWVRAKLVREYRNLSGSLKGIPRPDGDATYLSDLYADLDARIAVLHRRPGDGRDAIRADAQLKDRFASYGMDVCPV